MIFALREFNLLVVFIAVCSVVSAQKKNAAFTYNIHHSTHAITVDGVLDKDEWSGAEVATNFNMVLPMDTSYAELRTDVVMAYDENNIYLAAINYKKLKGKEVVESLRRDFNFVNNDNFILFLDPFDDRTNGFAFGTNAVGAQWDGLLYDGGKADLNWDNVWISATKNYDDRWVVEMSIPYKTLRFKKGITAWGINFSRNDVGVPEKSAWAPVPRQFPTATLAYTGTLVWDAPPVARRGNISVIPYVLTGVTKSYSPSTVSNKKLEAGGDVKVGITSSLNLDLTVNPDFSQVEVDQQVTNLDRYELFFPERRQFFLENGDQLNNFGFPSVRPFFSRRIGLSSRIQFGARLSGKIDRNWRITAMDVKTEKDAGRGTPSQNFTVFALQRKLFGRSNINLMFVNMQSLHYDSDKDSLLKRFSAFNRNLAVEYNLASSNNLWTGKLLAMKSFDPAASPNTFTHAGNLQYAAKKWLLNIAYESAGENYSAQVGYVPRRNYIRLYPGASYFFFPKHGDILTHGPQINTSFYYDRNFRETDYQNQYAWVVTYRSRATLSAGMLDEKVQLLFNFDPTNSGKDSLQKGSVHRWKTAGLDFTSKQKQAITYAVSLRAGGYYANGKKISLSASLGYRFQPYLNIVLNATYNELQLPKPWNITSFWLIGPKIDVTFTNKLFFTTYVQYNQQIKNTNINARFQWRYNPCSDFFIVYTDNYFTAPFSVRNRAVLLKFNYWWNI
jgi:hypothetical protein